MNTNFRFCPLDEPNEYTVGALLRCKDIIKEKNLTVIGIDYNNFYINAAQTCIEEQNMTNKISVHAISIYDEEALKKIMASKKVDSVYFSGSFSLLPDPKGALAAILKVLKPKGEVYITQSYQKKYSPVMSRVKPLIKFVTTIDFGQLVTVKEIAELLSDVDGLEVKEHDVMRGSLDNRWQAAYLSVLVRSGNGGGKVKVSKEKKGFWNWL
jgi:SAM-dependent methyltransferase